MATPAIAEQQARFIPVLSPKQSTPRERHLHLVPKQETNPLKDEQKQLLFKSIHLLTRKERFNLINTFSLSSENSVSSQTLIQAVRREGTANTNLKSILAKSFAGLIEEGEQPNSYHLTPEGIIVRKAADVVNMFFSKMPPEITMNLFGDENNTIIETTGNRIETLFEFALAEQKGVRQAELANLFHTTKTTINRTFGALRQYGIIEVDQRHAGRLTPMGKLLVDEVLIPLAHLSRYPEDRLKEIEQAREHDLMRPEEEIHSPLETSPIRRDSLVKQLFTQTGLSQEPARVEKGSLAAYREEISRYPHENNLQVLTLVLTCLRDKKPLEHIIQDPRFDAAFDESNENNLLEKNRTIFTLAATLAEGKGYEDFLLRYMTNTVVTVARNNQNKFSLELADLIGEGNLALLKIIPDALNKTGIDAKYFVGYVRNALKDSMRRANDEKASLIPLPVRSSERLRTIYKNMLEWGITHPNQKLSRESFAAEYKYDLNELQSLLQEERASKRITELPVRRRSVTASETITEETLAGPPVILPSPVQTHTSNNDSLVLTFDKAGLSEDEILAVKTVLRLDEGGERRTWRDAADVAHMSVGDIRRKYEKGIKKIKDSITN